MPSKGPVKRQYTINLGKALHTTANVSFKKRAPRAIKTIKKFAEKEMGTSDVRLDVALNKLVWSKGIKNVPKRIRVEIQRKFNDEEDAEEEFYSYVTAVEDQTTKGLGTVVLDE